jgi:probable F420-dependent oxidoreductase
MRPFRFGVEASTSYDRQGWRSFCQKVAALGYTNLVIVDHLGDQLAPVPAMVAAAEAAPELRVGTFVLDNELRHPVLLASEIATVDRLTDGRVEVGLGAGWKRAEHDQLGVPFLPPAQRVARLAEALTILKGLLSGETVSLSGQHYTVRDLKGFPVPVQRPHPPILVGGGGKRVLQVAARHADIVGLNPTQAPVTGSVMTDATAAATEAKIGWIRAAAQERFKALEINIRLNRTVVTSGWRDAADRLAASFGLSPSEVLGSPHLMVGDTERLVDMIEQHRATFGISYYVVLESAYRDFAQVVARLAGR